MRMPCWSQPRRRASLLNSAALSTYSSRGLPLIGHTASTPRRSSPARLSVAMCARHNPTEVADGASNVTTSPTTHRLHTQIAAVTYGRPIGNRCRSSTTITSTGVWSICTRSARSRRSAGGVRVGAFPRRHRLHRVQLLDAAQHRPPRRNPQATHPALPGDLPAHRRHRTALPSQIPRAQHLPHDRLNLVRQPGAAPAAAGPTRQQVRRHALTRAPSPDQRVHLAPGDPQFIGGLVGSHQPHGVLRGQPADHLGPLHCRVPCRARSSQHSALDHRTLDHSTTPARHTIMVDVTVVQTTSVHRADPNSSAQHVKRPAQPCTRLRTSTAPVFR